MIVFLFVGVVLLVLLICCCEYVVFVCLLFFVFMRCVGFLWGFWGFLVCVFFFFFFFFLIFSPTTPSPPLCRLFTLRCVLLMFRPAWFVCTQSYFLVKYGWIIGTNHKAPLTAANSQVGETYTETLDNAKWGVSCRHT